MWLAIKRWRQADDPYCGSCQFNGVGGVGKKNERAAGRDELGCKVGRLDDAGTMGSATEQR